MKCELPFSYFFAKILLIGFFILSFSFISAFSEETTTIHWETYSKALEKASIDKKITFLYISASWCISCKVLDKNVFTDPIIVNILNTKFHPTKLDVNSKEEIVCDGRQKVVERCFFDVWKLNGVPSFVLIAPKGLTILTLTQSLQAAEMRFLLQQILKKEKEWIQE